jgi:hypothetical protein
MLVQISRERRLKRLTTLPMILEENDERKRVYLPDGRKWRRGSSPSGNTRSFLTEVIGLFFFP